MKVNGVESAESVALLSKYAQMVKERGIADVVYECDELDLLVLHALVCLGADHPCFQDLSAQGRGTVDRFRGFCKRFWMTRGLSPKEADMLDRLRRDFAEKL